jgi:regulatory protein
VTRASKETCYASAMRMLVRREHSIFELTQKLGVKEFEKSEIKEALVTLIEQNYQSDERFAAEFAQMRFNQGKGPIKIHVDLKQRGIDQIDLSEFDFYALSKTIREKKFGHQVPTDFKQKAKQQRFLQSRGFNFEHINHAFESE